MSDRTQTVDPEIQALRGIEAMVLPLDLDTRERIATWLTARNEKDRFWEREAQFQAQIENQIDAEARNA